MKINKRLLGKMVESASQKYNTYKKRGVPIDREIMKGVIGGVLNEYLVRDTGTRKIYFGEIARALGSRGGTKATKSQKQYPLKL